RQPEGLDPQNTRSRVMPVSAASGRNRKARHEHVRTKLANDANDVSQHPFTIPNPQSLLGCFGKAKINRAREKLPAAVNPPRRQQFLRACNAQLLIELRSDLILAAVAAGQRKVSRAITPATRKIS